MEDIKKEERTTNMFIELHDWEGNPNIINIHIIKAVIPYKENEDSVRNLGKGNSLIEYIPVMNSEIMLRFSQSLTKL